MPALETTKRRRNLTLSPQAQELGEKLARDQKRSFSNWIEWLIAEESKRTTGDATPRTIGESEVGA